MSDKEMAPEEDKKGAEPETGADRMGGADSVGESEGGEGAQNAAATPDISIEGEHGQTAVDAPEDDAEKGADKDHRREA